MSETVLVVDDQPDIRGLLSEVMRAEGYRVLEASSGDQAVSLTRENTPDLILMDIMMPGRDGLSAVEEIRTRSSDIGIIVLTAFSTEQHVIRALQVGADDYMHKPFDPRELRTKVKTALEKCALRRENRRLQDKLAALLEQYLPQPVVQRLINSPDLPHLGGERQEITVLFADLRGFTDFTMLTPPEELILRLNRYLSIAAECILNRGGMVDKFMGDGVMAIFNAPLPDVNHLVNAIRAASDIHARVAMENAAVENGYGLKLEFGIGIHTGEAIVGNIGAASLMNYTAIGDVVNMTKRLEELALPGQTLVTQAVVDELGERLKVVPLPPLMVKGRSTPQVFFQMLSLE